MSGERADRAAQTVQVAAPAGVVYAALADAVKWPLFFTPSIHVERLEFDGERERLRMWSLVEGQLLSWTSWRHLDPVEHRIEFRQEVPAAVAESMRGVLTIHSRGPHRSEVELCCGPGTGAGTAGALHGDTAWAQRAAGLKAFAERWTRLDDLVLSFEDSVRVNGPAELVYDFLYRAGDWPELVAHVTGVHLTEDLPGIQRMTMQTLTEYGAHTTESVRICFPHAGRIIYKQSPVSPLLAAHTGEWSVTPDETGVTVTSRQTVLLREENTTALLGGSIGLAQVRRQVREALGHTCLALLAPAKQHAESAVRML
ncbi:aromatase/cyclase [Streptomyces sp. NPDC088747]|uniref:aromatase/cyclase n=1 Tax=Streptomyces sp. NPDC088747 TaxID=3365886 RepID=UPI00381E32F7